VSGDFCSRGLSVEMAGDDTEAEASIPMEALTTDAATDSEVRALESEFISR
jgi:hypothetical protein